MRPVMLAALVGALLFAAPRDTSAREAQLAPGVFESSITLHNSASVDALAALRFVTPDGTHALATPYTVSVPALGSALVYVPAHVAGLGAGRYSVEVHSDRPLVSITNLLSSGPASAASYSGFGAGDVGTTYFVPAVYKTYQGLFNSTVVVQNADTASAATVSIAYRNSLGIVQGVEAASIPPGAAHVFDQGTTPVLVNNFTGSAIVTSDRSVGASFFVSAPGTGEYSSSNGFRAGSTVAYLPVIYNAYSADGWVTSFIIQNVGVAPADVEVRYSDGRTVRRQVLSGSSELFFQGTDGTPAGFSGSVVATSLNDQAIVAVANIRNARGNLSAYNGFSGGSRRVSLPVIYRNYSSQLWGTSFTIQNVDVVSTDLTITYSSGLVETIAGLQPGASTPVQYQPSDDRLPNGMAGSVTVTSTNANIVGVVNELSLAGAPGDWLLSYNGFNR